MVKKMCIIILSSDNLVEHVEGSSVLMTLQIQIALYGNVHKKPPLQIYQPFIGIKI